MAYRKKDWVNGEVITEESLDNLEEGVTEAKKDASQAAIAAGNAQEAADDAAAAAEAAVQAAHEAIDEHNYDEEAHADIRKSVEDAEKSVRSIETGGTGANTAKGAEYNVSGGMSESSDALGDDTAFVLRHGSPSDKNGVFVWKKLSALWTLIASRIRSTFGFSSTNVLGKINGGTGNTTGEAPSATKLAQGRTIQINLSSTSAVSFDGTANVAPGVKGTLGVANGGTGATTADGACDSIGAVKKSGDKMTGSLNVANELMVLGTGWRPIGFKTVDGLDRGGMMVSDVNRVHFNVKETGAAYADRYLLPSPPTGKTSDSWFDILTTKNPVTVAQGGTGATTAIDALRNLGLSAEVVDIAADTAEDWERQAQDYIEQKAQDNRLMTFNIGWQGKSFGAAIVWKTPWEIFAIIYNAQATGAACKFWRCAIGVGWHDMPISIKSGGTGANNAAGAVDNLWAEIAKKIEATYTVTKK